MAQKSGTEVSRVVIPYLCVKNGAKAIEFYQQAFGATEGFRLAEAGGRIGHAEIKIEGHTVMLADEFPEMGILSPVSQGGARPPVIIHLYVDDCDATFNRAVAAGAKALRPLEDQFYGDRSGQITDPFGHVWMIATHKKEVSPNEMQRLWNEMLKQAKLE